MGQVTINDLDQTQIIDSHSDFVIIWDASESKTKKIKVSEMLSSSGGGGAPTLLRGKINAGDCDHTYHLEKS